jgi:hypothetical protein
MMSTFLEREKLRQATFKATDSSFSEAARAEGMYNRKPRPFCLPLPYATENLTPAIRATAPPYFLTRHIKWHDGHDNRPSNHLCSSHVCCVNFLFPFMTQPDALAHVLRPIFPTIHTMLPIEDGMFVTFEYIGQENYLGERMPKSGRRTRGAHCTSADAAVLFKDTDGRRHIVLIEWKYTESYGGTSLAIAKSGTDRTRIYKHLFEDADCPLNTSLIPDFSALFFEPFYQFMRQQFLAHKMEQAHEHDASVVSVLHIAPAQNTGFSKVTSPKLKSLGTSAVDIWKKLLRTPDRFISVSTEQLFGQLNLATQPEMHAWWQYINNRYPWLQEKTV